MIFVRETKMKVSLLVPRHLQMLGKYQASELLDKVKPEVVHCKEIEVKTLDYPEMLAILANQTGIQVFRDVFTREYVIPAAIPEIVSLGDVTAAVLCLRQVLNIQGMADWLTSNDLMPDIEQIPALSALSAEEVKIGLATYGFMLKSEPARAKQLLLAAVLLFGWATLPNKAFKWASDPLAWGDDDDLRVFVRTVRDQYMALPLIKNSETVSTLREIMRKSEHELSQRFYTV